MTASTPMLNPLATRRPSRQLDDRVEPNQNHQKDNQTSGGEEVLESLQSAYQNGRSNVIVENVAGIVEKLLTDDLEGSRHQRFIARVGSRHTILVVHNIDLAPRVKGLEVGDRITVKGEYEWNEQGGLIHWTHLDPQSEHEDGWIEHQGVRYE